MKLIVLAAGFATRLYPLTQDCPKALLPLGPRRGGRDKLLIEHVLDATRGISGTDRVYVVSNALFIDRFETWLQEYRTTCPGTVIELVNDGVQKEDRRLGAVGDLQFVIDHHNLDEDVAVVAGDNLFSQPLTGFREFCESKNGPVVGVYDVGDLAQVQKYSEVHTDGDGCIVFFEEKPPQPRRTLVAIALYYYPRAVLPRIREYLQSNNPDQSGRLIQWLYSHVRCYAWPVPGQWLDVGSYETLAAARRLCAEGNSLSSGPVHP